MDGFVASVCGGRVGFFLCTLVSACSVCNGSFFYYLKDCSILSVLLARVCLVSLRGPFCAMFLLDCFSQRYIS